MSPLPTPKKKHTYAEALDVAPEDLSQVQLLDLLLQTTWQTGVHGRASREDNVLVQVRAGIERSRLDSLEQKLGHTWAFNIHQVGLEHALGRLESFRANLDDTTVGKLIDIREKKSAIR